MFDLTGLSGAITSAKLQIYNPAGNIGVAPTGYVSSDATENLAIWDVSTGISSLLADQSGATGTYGDLGGGTQFGNVSVSAADDGKLVTIDLNAAAIAALNGASGQFAFGGSLTTLSGATTQTVFYSSGSSAGPNTGAWLVLGTSSAVPEPATWTLMIAAFLGLGFAVRRRRSLPA